MPWVTLSALSEQTGFAVRSLQYIRSQEPGVLITRERSGKTEYKQPDCATNLFRRERELAKREVKPASFEDARARKMEAEAREAELRVSKLLGEVIPTDMHETVVGEIADRLRAVIINIPSNYTLHLERLGIAPAQAEAVLEDLAEELTVALRGVADDVEIEASTEEEANGDGAPADDPAAG
jgi:phage terminase Nu1 subunit (DNA packaging protein)